MMNTIGAVMGLLLLLVERSHAHGYLSVPVSRAYYENLNNRFWNHMSGNGGVPGSIPNVCGDNYQGLVTNFVNLLTPIQATYTQGQEVELRVVLTSNHGGKFFFRVCPRSTNLDEACFGTNYLTRVDNGQRDTWLLNSDGLWVMNYRLPAGISCDGGCVLQWAYYSMQSCIEQGCNAAYCGSYANGINAVYGSNPGWCGIASGKLEYFFNCADIRIIPSGAAGTPSPPPAAGPAPSPPPPPVAAPPPPSSDADDDYAKVLGLSLLFYEAQQSGALPAWNRLLAGTNVAPFGPGYKKNAHVTDGAAIGKDLAGGWYDAGDYIKCPHPMGWALANIALAALEFKDIHIVQGQFEHALRGVGWGVDWLMKAHITASDVPNENVFVGGVSNDADHSYFGRPEHNPTPRPVNLVNSATGGADIAGEYAAAFAAAASLFRSAGNTTYAATLFKRAEQAFAFATAAGNTRNYVAPGWMAYKTYSDNGWLDHLAFASALMCKHTSSYCSAAEQWWNAAMASSRQFTFGYDWDSALPGAAAVLSSLSTGVSAAARTWVETNVLGKWENTASKCPATPYTTVCYTQKGLAWYSEWGTLRNTNNAVFLATLMGKYGATATSRQQHICWARRQMRYTLGSWGSTRSYLIGFGPSWPQRPHHRPSACSATYNEPCSLSNGGTCCAGESGIGQGGCCDQTNFMSSNPALITLWGGLVGGPDQYDAFPDVRNDYKMSEVAVDYNAGLTGGAAGLAHYLAMGDLAVCGAGPGTPPPPPPGSSPSPPPPPSGGGTSPPTGPCTTTIAAWSKCGGFDNACPSCVDAAWPNACCSSGNSCQRDNAWWWACKPGTAPASSPPPPPASLSPPPPVTPTPSPPVTPTPSPPVAVSSPPPPPPVSSPPSPPPPLLSPPPPVVFPSPPPPVVLPPPGTCTVTVQPWGWCGGISNSCPAGTSCGDFAAPGYCCSAGYTCTKDNAWWWMCTPAPTPPPPPPPSTCSNVIQSWQQCGGRSSSCPAAAGSCTDNPWQNFCCTGGTTCQRDNEWWWACKPAPTTTAAQTELVLAAISGDSVSAASATDSLTRELVDMLVISHPARASLKKGGRVRVKAALNRQGAPVAGATVFVQVSTTAKDGTSSTTTLSGKTKADGTAEITIPAKAKGPAGARSTIQAYTNEGRAQGAKGDVPLVSLTGRMVWVQ